MGGKAKIECYEYDLKGAFVRTYESLQEVRDRFFPKDKGKRPLFKSNQDYFKIENYGYIANFKIGRKGLKEAEKVKNSKYCKESKKMGTYGIEVFNFKGEKLAEFKNLYIMTLMTNIPASTIACQLNENNSKKQKQPKGELIFKKK